MIISINSENSDVSFKVFIDVWRNLNGGEGGLEAMHLELET